MHTHTTTYFDSYVLSVRVCIAICGGRDGVVNEEQSTVTMAMNETQRLPLRASKPINECRYKAFQYDFCTVKKKRL